jgi:hypothetical protein
MSKTINVTIKTEGKMFPGGTVGGGWMIMMHRDGVAEPEFSYHGPDPYAYFELEDSTVPVKYKVCGVRVDPEKQPLGNVICDDFIADPSLIEIDVASGISVSYVDVPVL